MTDNVIKLEKDEILKFEIFDGEGNSTGEFLEFDFADTMLYLRHQELEERLKKNYLNFKNNMTIIEKRQDVKGKKLLSKNEEDGLRLINEFLKKQEEAYNMFLGPNGVKKLLNGRNMNWFAFDKIDKIIEKQIYPHLEKMQDKMIDEIKKKYSQNNLLDKNDIEVLE